MLNGGASIVRLRRRTDMRRTPRLNFSYADFCDEVETMEEETIEEGVDAIEALVSDDVAVGCLISLELSEVGLVDSDVREVNGR